MYLQYIINMYRTVLYLLFLVIFGLDLGHSLSFCLLFNLSRFSSLSLCCCRLHNKSALIRINSNLAYTQLTQDRAVGENAQQTNKKWNNKSGIQAWSLKLRTMSKYLR